MADLDKIKVRKTNVTYDIADAAARDSINNLATVASSGDYEDLNNLPTLGTAAAKDSTSSVAAGSTDLVESGAVKAAIDAAVSAAYKPAGNKTCAELTSSLLVAANKGNVYNMTDSGVTTVDFMEGAGATINVGAEVGICEPSEGVFKFNLLPGIIDTSGFQTKTMSSPITVDGVSKATVEDALNAINTLAAGNKSGKQDKTLSAPVVVDGISKTTVEAAIGALANYTDSIDSNVSGMASVLAGVIDDVDEISDEVEDMSAEIDKLDTFEGSETLLDSDGNEILDSSNNRILDTQLGAAGLVITVNNIVSWFKSNLSHLIQDSGYTATKAEYEIINS